MNEWTRVCLLTEIEPLGSRVASSTQGDIAIFRTADDQVFALHDKCPHRGGPLSQGIVHGDSVTCPLHGWNFTLEDGQALAPDHGSCARFEVKVEHGQVLSCFALQ